MRVGVPTETKTNEFRVALTPAGVAELTRRGHEMLVQSGAGEGSSIPDSEFKAAGAQLADTAEQVWADAELLLKVKEPVPAEYDLLRRNQILFTFLHLAASRVRTAALLSSDTTSIAYETVQTADGTLPLLGPDERGGRPAVRSGGHLPPDAHPRRARRADGRGAGGQARRRRSGRGGHGRLQRGPGRRRDGSHGHGSRRQHQQASAARRRVRRSGPHPVFVGLRPGRHRQARRPGHRRGAAAQRQRPPT